jgi:tRNA (cytidine/uridine-2'-O-)-methyltransferase
MSGFHVVLLSPEIAGNTGSIIRLCANTGSRLHLVEPIAFELDDARLRRAGLDYHEYAEVNTHKSLSLCLTALRQSRVFAFSARAENTFETVQYRHGDALLFGPESTGLAESVVSTFAEENLLRIPMRPHTRSLNLSNAVAVAVYEGLRQLHYPLA